MSDKTPTLPFGTIIRIAEDDQGLLFAEDQWGNDVTDEVPKHVIRSCYDVNMCAELRETTTGGFQWRKVDYAAYQAARPESDDEKADSDEAVASVSHTIDVDKVTVAVDSQESSMEHGQVVDFIRNCYKYKPKLLKMREIHWKFAVRAVLRGENLMLRGDSGCGKTLVAQTLPKVLKRPFFYFNMGATQDARSTLIGNTHFKAGEGTYVAESLFVQAIQTPNAVILLDEFSRAHPDAHNILMTVLDKKQRYMRIDERPDTPTIPVANGVCFIATANVGTEYTATRTMDRAIMDRFVTLLIPHLTKEEEIDLLSGLFPTLPGDQIAAIAEIADDTRKQIYSDNPRVSTILSTRATVELASLLHDGFTLKEAAEVAIFPFFSEAGGPESEQAYMRAVVQQFVPPDDTAPNIFGNDPNGGAMTPWNP